MTQRTNAVASRPKSRRRANERLVGHSRRRFVLFRVAIVCSIVVLGGRLAFVQLVDGSRYSTYAQAEVEQQVAIPAMRGAVYDRSGDLLSASVPAYDVIADDFLVTAPRQEAAILAPILRLSQSALTAELTEHSGYVVIARKVSSSVESKLTALAPSGITFSPDDARVTAGGEVFQPLLGGVYSSGSGDSGLEYAENAVLAGTPGKENISEAPGGVVLPAGAEDVTAAKPGTSLVLTVDEPLQVEVTKDVTAQMLATHAQSGIAVITDTRTGAILAMVDLVVGAHGQIVSASQNLALTSIYQPGSVMKLATISFALQDGLITPSTTFTVPYSLNVGGYTFEDSDYHPTEQMTVSDILAQSSNIGTIEISRLLGLKRLAGALGAFGFGKPTGLDWPGESSGIVGTPAQWYGSAAASVPIGTGVAVTPMQVLDAYNTVANGGVTLAPHLVAATISGSSPEKPVRTTAGHRILTSATVSRLVPMLEGVVQDGTAVDACIPSYTVAGKTGTAQVPEPNGSGYIPGDFNATFVGFVPAQNPQLSGIVVLNRPTPIYGGTVSAPVFAKIMQYALRHFDIAPPSTSGTSKSQCAPVTTTAAP